MLQRHTRRGGQDLVVAAFAFAALTAAVTWPLSRHVATSLPGDLGDPLFATWVMAWVARHLTALLGGDLGAFARMWDAPIFAPEPHTLAYSEHFTSQAALVLPVYWAGGSPIAAYDTAFLASWWLSALGAYALVRGLTGRHDAALVAGTLYGFNLYRAVSLPHLQTLSAQWAPLAMAGALAFARTGSRWAAAGAALASLATALSSVYYLAFFLPLVAAFAVVALVRYDAWRTRRGMLALALTVVVVAAVLVPFLGPYVEAQRAMGVIRPRSEVEMSSLTLDAYHASGWHVVPMLVLAAAAGLWWRGGARELRWAVIVFAVAGAAALWLSLGPVPRWQGAPLVIPGLYGLLIDYVPGFSGLRVAARFAMVLMLALSVLAGLGAAALARAWPRAGTLVSAAVVAAHLVLYWTVPFPRDTPMATGPLQPVPAYLDPAAPVSPIHQAIGAIDPAALVVELPFGEPAYEIRYMYAQLAHGRRLLNGYSGVFPASYRARVAALRAPWEAPDAAWAALAPATHAVVHERAWPAAPQAEAVRRWLAERGASIVAEHDGATLWALQSILASR